MDKPNETQKSSERLAYNIAEAADTLGVSKVTIYRLLQRGKLQAVPGLRHKVIPRSSILKLLNTAE